MTTTASSTLEHAGLEHYPAIGYGAGGEDFLVRLDAVVRGADPSTVGWPDLEAAVTPGGACLNA